jgi:putative transposase
MRRTSEALRVRLRPLKAELFHHNRFDTVEAFTTALDDYIHWYNNERISTTLKGLSPVQYRAQTLAA